MTVGGMVLSDHSFLQASDLKLLLQSLNTLQTLKVFTSQNTDDFLEDEDVDAWLQGSHQLMVNDQLINLAMDEEPVIQMDHIWYQLQVEKVEKYAQK